jgi:hypothetical protein
MPRASSMTVFILLAGTLVLGGCSARAVRPYAQEPQECSRNFEVDGTALLGRSFSTDGYILSASSDKIFADVQAKLLGDAWQIIAADRVRGTLQARTKTASGVNFTDPLNITVEQLAQDVRMVVSFSSRAGQFAPESAVHRLFCDLFTVAGRSAHTMAPPQRSRPKRKPTLTKAPHKEEDVASVPGPGAKASDDEPKEPTPPAQVDGTIRDRY